MAIVVSIIVNVAAAWGSVRLVARMTRRRPNTDGTVIAAVVLSLIFAALYLITNVILMWGAAPGRS